MILKTQKEIEIMRESGKINSAVRKEVLETAKPGVTTWELNQLAEEKIKEAGAEPSFKGFEDFPFATCININDGVVHGYPSKDLMLKKGDLFTIDLGVYYKGFHSDAAETIVVAEEEKKSSFLKTGRVALDKAISACRIGNYIGDLSYAIQSVVESAGYSVVKSLVGHGIGREVHEAPQVPGYGEPCTGLELKLGAVLAIEVIYNKGADRVCVAEDGWTVITEDGSNSAVFEHTVAVTAQDPRVLTL